MEEKKEVTEAETNQLDLSFFQKSLEELKEKTESIGVRSKVILPLSEIKSLSELEPIKKVEPIKLKPLKKVKPATDDGFVNQINHLPELEPLPKLAPIKPIKPELFKSVKPAPLILSVKSEEPTELEENDVYVPKLDLPVFKNKSFKPSKVIMGRREKDVSERVITSSEDKFYSFNEPLENKKKSHLPDIFNESKLPNFSDISFKDILGTPVLEPQFLSAVSVKKQKEIKKDVKMANVLNKPSEKVEDRVSSKNLHDESSDHMIQKIKSFFNVGKKMDNRLAVEEPAVFYKKIKKHVGENLTSEPEKISISLPVEDEKKYIEEDAPQLPLLIEKNKIEKIDLPEKAKVLEKLKIPTTKFLESADFLYLIKNINEMKMIVSHDSDHLASEIDKKKNVHEEEFSKLDAHLTVLKEDLKKIIEVIPLKIKEDRKI